MIHVIVDPARNINIVMEKINKIEQENITKLEKPSSEYKESFIEAMKEFLNEGPNPDIGEDSLTEEKISEIEEKF